MKAIRLIIAFAAIAFAAPGLLGGELHAAPPSDASTTPQPAATTESKPDKSAKPTHKSETHKSEAQKSDAHKSDAHKSDKPAKAAAKSEKSAETRAQIRQAGKAEEERRRQDCARTDDAGGSPSPG